MNAAQQRTIVVGVDGSEHANRALAWAIEQAELKHDRIRVVTAWHVPPMAYGAPGYVPVSEPIGDSIRTAAEEVANAAVEQVRAVGLDAQASVVCGQAADVLVEAAEGAHMLVVGSRGHGGFAGLLLGSVSAQCAHHAPCPLVVIR